MELKNSLLKTKTDRFGIPTHKNSSADLEKKTKKAQNTKKEAYEAFMELSESSIIDVFIKGIIVEAVNMK